MMMNKFLGPAALVAGAIVGWFGWQEYQSVGSKISSAIAGAPTDRAIWMLAIGGVLIVVGAGLTFKTLR